MKVQTKVHFQKSKMSKYLSILCCNYKQGIKSKSMKKVENMEYRCISYSDCVITMHDFGLEKNVKYKVQAKNNVHQRFSQH